MKTRAAPSLLLLAAAVPLAAQQPSRAMLPSTVPAIREWDLGIVRRVEAMIDAPARWNRSDAARCKHGAASFSIRCALELAADEAVNDVVSTAHGDSAAKRNAGVTCSFAPAAGHLEGSCGELFEEATVFSIAPAKAITTGAWRKEGSPKEVWSGRMINPAGAVMDAARRLVDSVAPGKYRKGRLAEYNDDPSVSFTDLQGFFRALEARVSKLSTDELTRSFDDVEIERYPDDSGIIRTYNGWYAASDFSTTNSNLRFRIDTTAELAPNALDADIVRRAASILSSDAVWNRADNRTCAAGAKTWSIYCALEDATRELTGGFHHRRPALETVRIIVEERTKGRDYNHRLMDYNNDSTTHLSDVRSLFAAALAKMPH